MWMEIQVAPGGYSYSKVKLGTGYRCIKAHHCTAFVLHPRKQGLPPDKSQASGGFAHICLIFPNDWSLSLVRPIVGSCWQVRHGLSVFDKVYVHVSIAVFLTVHGASLLVSMLFLVMLRI